MSTAQEAPEAPAAAVKDPRFVSRIDPRWALSLEQVVAVAVFGLLFVLLNFIPLRPTDLWGHVAYGHWIIDHRRLPMEDPAMPLAQGVEVIDTAWLSQVIFAAVDRYLGPEAISHLFALTGLAAYLVWARVFYRQTARVWLSIAGVLLLILIGWSRLATVRPENFAMLAFAVLFLLLARIQFSQVHERTTSGDADVDQDAARFDLLSWLAIPALFLLWANLHGSFVVGIFVLACIFAGRAIEVLWRSRSVVALLRDADARRWLVLTEAACLATLINPYGLDLWIHTLRFASNPNLTSIVEWQPLTFQGIGGKELALSFLLLLVVWRHSRRPVRPAEVLLLAVFALLAVSGIRMIGWYAPVFVYVVAPHVAEILARLRPKTSAGEVSSAVAAVGVTAADTTPDAMPAPAPGYSFRYSIIALLLIWIAFALSPAGRSFLGKQRTPQQLYGPSTPIALATYLNQTAAGNPAAPRPQWDEQVFHSQQWGDWLDRSAPPEFRPFVTSNVHLAPAQVWRDYHRINSVRSGWDRTLERYRVGTVIVDKKEQFALLGMLQRHADWQLVYEDPQAAVFVLRADRTPRNDESQNSEPIGDTPA